MLALTAFVIPATAEKTVPAKVGMLTILNTTEEEAVNLLTSDFSFMMLEGREELRDAFEGAIEAIKADGTLDRLVAEQIDAAIAGDDISAVDMPVIDGTDTVRVAVTGMLPPMDYIAADGTPAGFNTALLAEISNRIGKNIELVVVDSVGRADALANGTVDAVFWTRANSKAFIFANFTEEKKAAEVARLFENAPEAEIEVLERVVSFLPPEIQSMLDIPEGTIVTSPYYSDMILPVSTKAFMETVKNQ